VLPVITRVMIEASAMRRLSILLASHKHANWTVSSQRSKRLTNVITEHLMARCKRIHARPLRQ
jgi:hypothetical protein